MIEAGKLNRQVTLSTPTAVRNSVGEETRDFRNVADVWAEAKQLSLTEVQRAAGLGKSADAKILIRWRGDVSPGWRATLDGRTYQVVSVDEQGHRTAMILVLAAL